MWARINNTLDWAGREKKECKEKGLAEVEVDFRGTPVASTLPLT